jgi:hypothetical protein
MFHKKTFNACCCPTAGSTPAVQSINDARNLVASIASKTLSYFFHSRLIWTTVMEFQTTSAFEFA